MSQIARLELLTPEERLNPEQLMADLETLGKTAAYLPDAEARRLANKKPSERIFLNVFIDSI